MKTPTSRIPFTTSLRRHFQCECQSLKIGLYGLHQKDPNGTDRMRGSCEFAFEWLVYLSCCFVRLAGCCSCCCCVLLLLSLLLLSEYYYYISFVVVAVACVIGNDWDVGFSEGYVQESLRVPNYMFKCCPQQADPTNNAWKLMLQYSLHLSDLSIQRFSNWKNGFSIQHGQSQSLGL